MKRIIDTNVINTANGQADHMSSDCEEACIDFLIEFMEKGVLVVDDKRNGESEIINEYERQISYNEDDIIGNRFVKWISWNERDPDHIERIPITPSNHCEVWYKEITKGIGLENFDRSDRKFVAVAFAHPEHPAIVNATDTDWLEVMEILSSQGIEVINLCSNEIERIHRERGS